MTTKALLTETNTPDVERRVLAGAAIALHRPRRRLAATFEHGQWWITDLRTGGQWSVCDMNAEPGFYFELVTPEDAR